MTAQAKIGPHWRIPWRRGEPDQIRVHCRFDQLKGTYRRSAKEAARGEEQYVAAKRHNDHAAAADLVESLVDAGIVDVVVDAVIASGRPVRVIFPHPEFDPDEKSPDHMVVTNAIPFAFAAWMAAELGGAIEENIIECARPGRTRLNRFQRFAWQPRFTGEVDPDVAYILVDDNCTLGGTLAMLRTHIVGNGGTVVAVCALSTPNGRDCRFSIADRTIDVLLSEYTAQISPIWIEEIGHDITCLTESEGSFVAEWGRERGGKGTSLLQQLRDRLAKAKAKGE